ncbi:MAG: glycosyltransferase family 2 protein [Bacteroidetes bacterium]|nr:glycosyltransferase family 2 protein [Bacteroidota bacterium]
MPKEYPDLLNKKQTLVSIIIPCYNVSEYISECIDSVLAQTHSNIEIICVNNNSSDRTNEILQSYKAVYPDKIIVLQEFKKGAPIARNKGLSVAKGEWIQFLDADDLLLRDKIEHQLKMVAVKPDTGFIASAYFKQDVSGNKREKNLEQSDPFKALFQTNLGITSSNLFNVLALKNIGGWNESLNSSQEADLMLRLLKKDWQVVYDIDPKTIIRQRVSGQISQSDPEKKWKQYIELRLQLISYLKSEKTFYFNKNKDFYFQKLFLQLRRLSRFDLETAYELYEKHFEKKFKPSVHPVYNILFKFFGFKNTEKLSRFL